MNLVLDMNRPFSPEAFDTFLKAVPILFKGMGTVILVLLAFYLIIKLLIRIFPDKG